MKSLCLLKCASLLHLKQLTVSTDFSFVQKHHRHKTTAFTVDAIGNLHLILTVYLIEHNFIILYLILVEQFFCFRAVWTISCAYNHCLLLADNLVQTLHILGFAQIAPQFLHYFIIIIT